MTNTWSGNFGCNQNVTTKRLLVVYGPLRGLPTKPRPERNQCRNLTGLQQRYDRDSPLMLRPRPSRTARSFGGRWSSRAWTTAGSGSRCHSQRLSLLGLRLRWIPGRTRRTEEATSERLLHAVLERVAGGPARAAIPGSRYRSLPSASATIGKRRRGFRIEEQGMSRFTRKSISLSSPSRPEETT